MANPDSENDRVDDIAEAEIVDKSGDQVGQQAESHTAALVPLDTTASMAILTPAATVEEARKAFNAYVNLRASILVDSDYQRAGQKTFVTKSGWRKLAVVMNVSAELLSRDYQRDVLGRVRSAEVVVRAISPNGRYQDGMGICDLHERCCPRAFGENEVCKDGRQSHHHCQPGCDGFNHFSKPQHDIPSTAFTRAENRAFSDLFGFGEVSAEEVTDEPAADTDIATIVRALNGLEASQRGPAKTAFAAKFGLPKDLQQSQVEGARRFVKSVGGDLDAVPDATATGGEAAPSASAPPAQPPAASTDPSAPPQEPEDATDESASDTGSEVGTSSESGPSPSDPDGEPSPGASPPGPPSGDGKPSTAQQRQRVGIAYGEIEKLGVVKAGDKAEIVAIVTQERAQSTTQTTVDEAAKIIAAIMHLKSGALVMLDDAGGRRMLGAPKGSGVGEKFLKSLPGGAQ